MDRLGFFTEVNVETQDVPGLPDQVDLVVNVTEAPPVPLQLEGTRFLQCRKGRAVVRYQTKGKLLWLGQLPGYRRQLSTVYRRTWCSSTTNPYFTQDGISRTVDLYYH